MSASAGRVLLMPKGTYDATVTYTMLDVVFYNSKSYVCKQTTVGNDPTNTVYWQVLLDGASALSDLTDVELTNLQDGDGIYYNGTEGKWMNSTADSIEITSPPVKTSYNLGEILDLTGIVVMATYSTGTTRNITSECTFSPANGATLDITDTTITVTWHNLSTTQAITVIAPIYGVSWSDSVPYPTMTRTDDAVNFVDPVPALNNGTGSSPFDDIMPWKGMTVVEDINGGTVVAIPKFYYQFSGDSSNRYIRISMDQKEGFRVSPAHMDRGDGKGERDVVYVARYLSGGIKSATGVDMASVGGKTRAQYRSAFAGLDANIWQVDYLTLATIWLLYLVEFANRDSQATIGGGCSRSSDRTTGATDAMAYHTGTTATARNGQGHVQYRHIEDIWSNSQSFIDGVNYSAKQIYLCKNPANFADDATSGNYYYIGASSSTGGTIQIMMPAVPPATNTGFDGVPYCSGNSSTDYSRYFCDSLSLSNAVSVFAIGAYTDGYTTMFGLFYHATYASSFSNQSTVGRLMILP